MKRLVIQIPSGSPEEDRLSYVKAIINSLKYQRGSDLPMDMQEHNFWLLELCNHLLPGDEEVAQFVRCLEKQRELT